MKKVLFFLALLCIGFACQNNEKKPQSPIIATSTPKQLSPAEQDSVVKNQQRLKIYRLLTSIGTDSQISHSKMLEVVSCLYGNFEPQTNFNLIKGKTVELLAFTPQKFLSKRAFGEWVSSNIEEQGESWHLIDSLSNNLVAMYENDWRWSLGVNFQYVDMDGDKSKELFMIIGGSMFIFEQKDTFWQAIELQYNMQDVGDFSGEPEEVFASVDFAHENEYLTHNRTLFTASFHSDHDSGNWYRYERAWFCYRNNSLLHLGTFLNHTDEEQYYSKDEDEEHFKYFRSFDESYDVELLRPHTDTLLYQYIVTETANFGSDNPTDKVMFYNINLAKTHDAAVDTNLNINLLCDTLQQTYIWNDSRKKFEYHSTQSLSPYFSDEEAQKLIKNDGWKRPDYKDLRKANPQVPQTRAQQLFEKAYFR